MTRELFTQELNHLQEEMMNMAYLVDQAMIDAVESLRVRDMQASKRIIAQDKTINKLRYELENACLVVIATQQPMAVDLRVVAAILDIAKELERMGDYAKGIARINLLIGDEPLIKPLIDIPRMAQKWSSMLKQALQAFIQRDITLAAQIPLEDDEVDYLYEQVYRELITHLLATPSKIKQANYLLWAAHNLERASDRVTNICERVIFMVTGELIETPSKDNDNAEYPSP